MSKPRGTTTRIKQSWVVALALAVFAASSPRCPAATNNLYATALASITDEELYHHVEVLADDIYEGRAAGSRGGRAAGQYLIEQLKADGLTPAGEDGEYAQSFNGDCRNLFVQLPGDDPQLAKEVVVIGAHYDHVGYGKPNNSFGPYGQIHNGADDNASGSSVLLEVAQAFARSGLKTRRTLLFAFWDSEEAGLLGSRYWIAHPTLDLDRVKFSITIDMVGRLRDEHLLVLGTRSGFGMRRLLSDAADDPLSLDFSWELTANSDHWPFLEHDIPIALIHTGLHSDYHRPTDDVEKINRVGMREVGRYLLSAIIKVANEDHLPTFRSAVKRETDRGRRELERPLAPASLADWPVDVPRPRLGITWREDEAEPGSVILIRVVAGSPAEAAGLRVGDRVDEVGGNTFANGNTLQASIHDMLDSGQREIPLLIERSGRMRTVVVNMASLTESHQKDDNTTPVSK
jgi:hypothetical protein